MKSKKIYTAFIFILLVAISLRLLIIYTKYHNINSDNGILGLMAKHILKGEFPMFFYGQSYMGSIEAFIIAFLFLFFGISTKTMSLSMTFVTTGGVISSYFLGKELKDRTLGLYAMLITAIPPVYIFWHGIAAFGGYPETFLFGNILLTLTLKIIKYDNYNFKKRYYIILGLIGGIAFWTHILIIYYIFPISIFLFINEKKKFFFLKTPLLVIPAFITGSLPLWIYNIKYKFDTFSFPPPSNFTKGLEYFIITFLKLISFNKSSLSSHIVLLIYIFSFIFLIINPEKPAKNTSQKFIFFLLFISIGYFFSTSHLAHVCCPRYIIPLFSVLLISAAYLVWHLNNKIRYIGFIPLFLVLSFNSLEIYKSYIQDKKESYDDHMLFTDLISFLNKNKLYTNYCTFSISQKLNFLNGEVIINADYEGEKYPPYEEIVETSDNIAFIERDNHLEPMFNMLCKDYKKSQIGPFCIYYNLQPKGYYGNLIQTQKWRAISNYNNKDLKFAFDRNADTYWGTITPKTKGMYLELDLGNIYNIYKIALFNNGHWKNFPQDVSIETSCDGENWAKLGLPNYPEPLFWIGTRPYWHLQDGRIEFIFHPSKSRFIKISQDQMDSQHPWEINEIFVWEYLDNRLIDSSELQEIYNFLNSENIRYTYTDFWLSAKIGKFSNGKIKTLKPINKQYPFRKDTSRFIDLDKDTAFIIDNENISVSENYLNIPNLQKKEFKNYTCLYTKHDLPKKEIYYWSGYSLLKTNRFLGLEGIPIIKEEIVFNGGIKFLGYNVQTFNHSLKIDYFWQVKKLPRGLFAFVHFIKDNKIIFQNDHPLLEQFPFSETIAANQIYRESYTIENIPPGMYKFSLGLWIPDKNKRLEVINIKGNKHEAIIGNITTK